MHEYITKYVRNCEICRATKPTNEIQVAPMGSRVTSDRAWQALFVDFVGPFPRSKQGFVYLFVVVDAFSKFVRIHPVRTATAKCVIRFLERDIFLLFGVPDRIVSDNGSQFVSREYRKFLELYKVKPTYVSRYHPQAYAAEAANKSIENAIRSYIAENHRDWDRYLPQINCALNTAFHSSISMSPYFANFGCHMTTLGNNLLGQRDPEDHPDEPFREIRESVKRSLEKSYESSKNRYDLRTRPIKYAVGETVWRLTFQLSDASKNFAAKLAPRYQKCIVKAVRGTSSYELTDESGKNLGIFSTKDLKRN